MLQEKLVEIFAQFLSVLARLPSHKNIRSTSGKVFFFFCLCSL